MSDNTLKLAIDLQKTGEGGAQAQGELKAVADDSARYQATLAAMAAKEEAAKDGATELNAAVREYAEAVKAAKSEMESGGGAFIPDNLAGKLKETGAAMDEAGGKAGNSAGKHLALRRIMGELNRISPGLGEAMHLLSEAYLEAGEAAEGGAVGVAGFTAALDALLVSLGPLIIAMLSIEAVMQYWDMYKDKVKAAQEAQTEACKKMVEDTHAARKAVEELNEAMHPKEHNTAETDEKNLARQKQDLENNYNRQKELNKAQEEKEQAGARSGEEKEQIRARFEQLDKQLEDWRDKQKAAIEGAMAQTMEGQLKQLKEEGDRLIAKRTEARKSGDTATYDSTTGDLEKNTAAAKAIREKLDNLNDEQSADATNAAFNSETNRQVAAAKGQKYVAPAAGYSMPNPDAASDNAAGKFATGKSIADTAQRGGKVNDDQAQYLITLEQSITGQKQTFASAVALIEAQSANHEFMAQLLANSMMRIAAVSQRLSQLESQFGHSSNTHVSG